MSSLKYTKSIDSCHFVKTGSLIDCKRTPQHLVSQLHQIKSELRIRSSPCSPFWIDHDLDESNDHDFDDAFDDGHDDDR